MSIFSKKAPLNKGNSFITNEILNAQEEIDINNIEIKPSAINKIKNYFNSNDSKGKKFLNERSIPAFWLMQYQANYFCNLFNYKCENPLIKENIIKILRCAFFSGEAGFYFDNLSMKFRAVSIVKKETNFFGDITKIEIANIDDFLSSQTDPKLTKHRTITLEGADCLDVIIFRWGSMAISAWITIYPIIRQQETLLRMMNTVSISFIKKYMYNVKDSSAVKNELDLFFDPDNIFIVNSGFGESALNNKFSSFQVDNNSNQRDLLDFYREWTGIYYSLWGRRYNEDIKDSNNVAGEVRANQISYDILHKDLLDQFEIFINRMNLKIIEVGFFGDFQIQLNQEEINEGTDTKFETEGETND